MTEIIKGPLAQRSEQSTHNRLVVGSNPTRPTMHVDRASERSGLQNHLCRERYPGRAPLYGPVSPFIILLALPIAFLCMLLSNFTKEK